jgi:hypothetical protein
LRKIKHLIISIYPFNSNGYISVGILSYSFKKEQYCFKERKGKKAKANEHIPF